MTDKIDLQSPEGMDGEWLTMKAGGGVMGAEANVYYPDEGYDLSAVMAIRKDYRWTPACQRMFLEELACCGSITNAAKFVEKSIRAAYCLRFRRDGTAFRLGWDAAILIARDRLADMLMDRSICGYEEFRQKEDDGTQRHGKFDNRLSAYTMSRLDRIAEREALTGSRAAQVQLVVQDFESFLDLIGRGGTGADAALFFEAIEPMDGDGDWLREGATGEPGSEIAGGIRSEIDCELARISEDEEADEEPEYLMDEEPEQATTRMHVWWDEDSEKYWTNFPLSPADREAEDQYRVLHQGEEYPANITEYGHFGHHGYRRVLTPHELELHRARQIRDLAPWTEAAQAARDAWFGEKEAA